MSSSTNHSNSPSLRTLVSWRGETGHKFQINVKVCEIVLANTVMPDGEHLEIMMFRGSRNFRTHKAKWSNGKAAWNQPLAFTCTLFKGKNDKFKQKAYKFNAVSHPKEKTLASFSIDAADLVNSNKAHCEIDLVQQKCQDKNARLRVIISCNSVAAESEVENATTTTLRLSSGLEVPVPNANAEERGWRTVAVTLFRQNGESLGLGLEHTGIYPNDYILVESLVPMRPASLCEPQIKLGSVLQSANGRLIRGLTFDDVQHLMSTDEVHIVFLEPPDKVLRNYTRQSHRRDTAYASNDEGLSTMEEDNEIRLDDASGESEGEEPNKKGAAKNTQLVPSAAPTNFFAASSEVEAGDSNSMSKEYIDMSAEEQLHRNLVGCRQQLESCEEELGNCSTNVRSALLLSFRTCVHAQHLVQQGRTSQRRLQQLCDLLQVNLEAQGKEVSDLKEQLQAAKAHVEIVAKTRTEIVELASAASDSHEEKSGALKEEAADSEAERELRAVRESLKEAMVAQEAVLEERNSLREQVHHLQDVARRRDAQEEERASALKEAQKTIEEADKVNRRVEEAEAARDLALRQLNRQMSKAKELELELQGLRAPPEEPKKDLSAVSALDVAKSGGTPGIATNADLTGFIGDVGAEFELAEPQESHLKSNKKEKKEKKEKKDRREKKEKKEKKNSKKKHNVTAASGPPMIETEQVDELISKPESDAVQVPGAAESNGEDMDPPDGETARTSSAQSAQAPAEPPQAPGAAGAERDINELITDVRTKTLTYKGTIKEGFDSFDVKGEGFLSRTAFKNALAKLGVEATDDERRILRRQIDVNGNKKITYEEWVEFIESTEQLDAEDVADLSAHKGVALL